MKTVLWIAALLLIVSPVLADPFVPAFPTKLPILEIQRDLFYCQGEGMQTIVPLPASASDELEIADDIPMELIGLQFNEVGFSCMVVDIPTKEKDLPDPMVPTDVTLSIYLESCPCAQEAEISFTTDWADLDAMMIEEGTNFQIYWVEMLLPAFVEISPGMSLGWTFGGDYGMPTSYAGVLGVDTIAGDCPAWISGPLFNLPRWTPIEVINGFPVDVDYCLGITQTAAEESNWSVVKSLY